MTYNCPDCGESFTNIGAHWGASSCNYPKISDNQHEIITGMLMGDASINCSCSNARLQCNMINKDYLEYVDSQFPIIGSGVKIKRTASENAKLSRKTGFTSTVNEENYNDQYRWQTLSNPHLNTYADWYNSGKKVFPDDIQLTPTVIKHWYCTDGSIEKQGNFYRIKITSSNEIQNKEKLENMFIESGLPSPDYYSSNKDLRWNKESSKKLLQYMGEPLPGFSYKW